MNAAANLLRPLCIAFVTPAVVVLATFAFDWRLALAMPAAAPVAAAAYRWSGRLMARADRQSHAAAAETADRLVEFARHQPALRAFGRTAEDHELLDAALREQHAKARAAVRIGVPGIAGFALAVQLCFTCVLLLGTVLAVDGSVGAGELIAVLVLAVRFVEPMGAAAELGGSLRIARGTPERLGAVLAAEPLPQPATMAPLPDTYGIELDGVSFGYGDGRTVLDGLDLRVPAGHTVALVGPSGSGKTAVTRLIARFWDVTGGTVRVGGTDVRDLTTEQLMSRLAMVFQDVYLFAGSIEDNIRAGREDATDEEVREAGRIARVDEITERLPDGWAARVGEGGAALSGGERQRISLARALLKQPRSSCWTRRPRRSTPRTRPRSSRPWRAHRGPHGLRRCPPPRHHRRCRPDRVPGGRADRGAGYARGTAHARRPVRGVLAGTGTGGRVASGGAPLETGTRRVSTQPLAGTRALGTRPEETARLRADLLGDPKEIHEHALSVRLAVDELTGICRQGTVVVEEFMTVRERGSVQHLVSRATGRLADGQGPRGAFAALFPAITATGCPKPEALRTISRYESEPRGLYAGPCSPPTPTAPSTRHSSCARSSSATDAAGCARGPESWGSPHRNGSGRRPAKSSAAWPRTSAAVRTHRPRSRDEEPDARGPGPAAGRRERASSESEAHQDVVTVVAGGHAQRTRPSAHLRPAQAPVELLKAEPSSRTELQLLQFHVLGGDLPDAGHEGGADSPSTEVRVGLDVVDHSAVRDQGMKVPTDDQPARE